MRLRCKACGCFVHALLVWVKVYTKGGYHKIREVRVQPCKRCLSRTDLGQVVIAVHLFALFKVLARDYERAASAASE